MPPDKIGDQKRSRLPRRRTIVPCPAKASRQARRSRYHCTVGQLLVDGPKRCTFRTDDERDSSRPHGEMPRPRPLPIRKGEIKPRAASARYRPGNRACPASPGAEPRSSAKTKVESGPDWRKAGSDKIINYSIALYPDRRQLSLRSLRAPCPRVSFGSNLGGLGRDAGTIPWHSELHHLGWNRKSAYRLVNRQGEYFT